MIRLIILAKVAFFLLIRSSVRVWELKRGSKQRIMQQCMIHMFLDLVGPLLISMILSLITSLGFCRIGNEANYNLVNRMHRDFDAQLWTFDPEFDPPALKKYDQFGCYIFVARNPNRKRVHWIWQAANKYRIAVDPGGKVFETIYNIGTGDVFYVGAGLSDSIRYNLNRISYLQSEMDKEVDRERNVRERKRYWDTYTDSLEMVLFYISNASVAPT